MSSLPLSLSHSLTLSLLRSLSISLSLVLASITERSLPPSLFLRPPSLHDRRGKSGYTNTFVASSTSPSLPIFLLKAPSSLISSRNAPYYVADVDPWCNIYLFLSPVCVCLRVCVCMCSNVTSAFLLPNLSEVYTLNKAYEYICI